MFALIGRVRLKPGREDEALAMIAARGVAMVQGMAGSAGGYWARTLTDDETIQHSFSLFDTPNRTRAARERRSKYCEIFQTLPRNRIAVRMQRCYAAC